MTESRSEGAARAAQTMPGRDELICEFLWRVYGYPGDFADAHPVTIDKYRQDAVALVDELEQAGYVLVKADRWERVQKWAAVGDSFQHELWLRDDPEWIPAELQPGDLDAEVGA